MTTHMIMTEDEIHRDGWNLPTINIPHVVWREAGTDIDKRAMLKATMKIGDAQMHLQAIGVHLEHLDEEGETTHYPVMDTDAAELDGCRVEFDEGAPIESVGTLWVAFSMDGLPETVEIEGRRYAVFASPFCL